LDYPNIWIIFDLSKQETMTTVKHPQFGTGTVVSQDSKNVTVNFGGLVKTLIIRFSKLTHEDGTAFGEQAVAPVKKAKKLNRANFMTDEERRNSAIAKMSKDEWEARREAAKRSSHSTFY
jgi:hypothetical protein